MSADFQDRMAIGKANSLAARNEGGSTVRVYATTTAMLAPLGRIPSDNFDRWLAEVTDYCKQVVEDSRWQIYGEQWEGLEL